MVRSSLEHKLKGHGMDYYYYYLNMFLDVYM